ncbi:MAG TPA: ABC transporter transmembrane domain-containing protein, partial [Longimicrobiales bacterium]|nr:ABC transporter transmembrane domain-containing protein [Longimicrobiales bacterium]
MLRLSFQPVRRAWRRRLREWASWWRMAERLGPYIRRRKRRLGLALLAGLGYTALGLLEPWPLKLILDSVILGHPLPGPLAVALGFATDGTLTLLWVLVASIMILAVARGLLYYHQKLLTARVGQQVTADMRIDLYRHLQRLSFTFHDRRRTGDILARLTSDIRLLR